MAKCTRCGKGGIGNRLSSSGLCSACLQDDLQKLRVQAGITQKALDEKEAECEALLAENKDLRHKLTPDVLEICANKEKAAKLEAEIEERAKTVKALKEKEKEIAQQIIVANDVVEMESFALYTPKYAFVTSQEYKDRLDEIRAQEKAMIREKSAASCSTEWTVRGSRSEGKKMTNDNIKMLLRSFNNECDAAVTLVKFSNFDRCLDRIRKAFDTINQLGASSDIRLSTNYLRLKVEELTLAYEYQCKKQEEKEALRVLREQQREEAKLAKEIEAARKEAEKEKKHYIQALESVKAQLAACTSESDRAALVEKQDDLVNHLDDMTKKLEDIDYRQSNQRAGYVYIISNIGSFGEGVYKIGMTRRLDPMERVYELGDASVPFMFDVHAMIFSDDAPKLEAALHQAFADRRVNRVNTRREYFRVSLDEIKEVVRKNHDKTVEFIDVPDAQQFRESRLMENATT